MRFCDTITLYNYLGERGGEAAWQRTLLKNVRAEVKEGACGRELRTERRAVVYAFDRAVRAEREYIPKAAFDCASDRSSYYTFSPGDCFVLGECGGSSPEAGYFRISEVESFDRGSRRTRHKRICGV